MRKAALVALGVIVGCAACAAALAAQSGLLAYAIPPPRSAAFSQSMLSQACETRAVDLTRAAPFAWDHVVILTPYSGQQQADELIGSAWRGYWRFEHTLVSEAENVFVFVKGEKVQRAFAVGKRYGRFESQVKLSRARARLRRADVSQPCEWPELQPAQQSETA